MPYKSSRSRYLIIPLLLLLLLGGGYLAMQMHTWPHVPTYGAMLYGYGVPNNYQSCGWHTGGDWFAPEGTPIFAIEDGVVIHVGPLWFDGPDVGRGPYSIILYHEEAGYYTTYGHNRVALVEPADLVQRGQQIAELGDLGYSGSPHLHLEKVVVPYTGDWQHPFVGCDGYVDPGNRWSPF
ncbi:MAG: M23 family metallopeptidase [Ardenticatenales bacterium]|nr:M23 family metallopeptidase [Ardenticatenales bacterium]